MEPKSIVLVGIYDFRVSDYKIGIRKESTFPLHRTLCYLLLCLLVFLNGLPCLGHENMLVFLKLLNFRLWFLSPHNQGLSYCVMLIILDSWFVIRFDVKALYVGKELWRETLSLQSGSRVYKLEGFLLWSEDIIPCFCVFFLLLLINFVFKGFVLLNWHLMFLALNRYQLGFRWNY